MQTATNGGEGGGEIDVATYHYSRPSPVFIIILFVQPCQNGIIYQDGVTKLWRKRDR